MGGDEIYLGPHFAESPIQSSEITTARYRIVIKAVS